MFMFMERYSMVLSVWLNCFSGLVIFFTIHFVSITVLRFFLYKDTYSEARKKLRVAEDKSDLNTTDPDECGRGKRQKFKKRLQSSSSSTGSEDDMSTNLLFEASKFPKDIYPSGASQKASKGLLQLEEPPPFSKIKSIYLGTNPAPDNDDDDDFTLTTENDYGENVNLVSVTDESFTLSSENVCNIIPPSESLLHTVQDSESLLPQKHMKSKLVAYSSKPASDASESKSNESVFQTLHISDSLLSKSKSKPVDLSSLSGLGTNEVRVSQLTEKKKISNKSGTSGFETTVLREISILKMKVNTIMEKLDCMINHANVRETLGKTDYSLIKDLKNLIPVTSSAELEKLEEILKDENIFNQMIQFLSKLGGYSCEQATKLMLRRVMTDDVAMSFSYLGIRDKRAFKPLEICKVILCAVRTHVSWCESSETAIEKTMSNWLRHAKSRLESKKKPPK